MRYFPYILACLSSPEIVHYLCKGLQFRDKNYTYAKKLYFIYQIWQYNMLKLSKFVKANIVQLSAMMRYFDLNWKNSTLTSMQTKSLWV